MIPAHQAIPFLRALWTARLSASPAVSAPGQAFDRDAFFARFARATRQLGTATLALSAEERDRARAAGVEWLVNDCAADEAARILMILAAAERLAPESVEALVDDAFRRGDNRERRATLRCLGLFPDPPRYLPLAAQACRSSVQTVFEAIACENPYPADHFPALNFNQMVLKALFTGVALARIVGLSRRASAELARMARDFASERRAAGRPVPGDIALALHGAGE